ncbi:unnamed protein product [Spirodela intermedia]|uniref:Uncharacterized protein n=1 Tax=Spirodela intermedia TaxID=51605 RepID=A0A7I8IPV6_SPIIN|nr:unnamed protein product [Spirodela intermedia]CAA6659811.1 unnamed protein product [Spirodela intermedia]
MAAAALVIAVLCSFSLVSSAPESALYVTVDEKNGRNLFYYFVFSEGNPEEDPVVLWLNGGPGCSSFDGFVYEHGRNLPGSLPQLQSYPYSWSKHDILGFPAGVGLSYSHNPDDYTTGDLKTWFELYPEFLGNPFFISGESFAEECVTDTVFDGDALVHMEWSHINDLYQKVNSACQGSYWNPVNETCMTEVEDLNIYDILEPCYHRPEIKQVVPNARRLPESFKNLGHTHRPLPAPVRDGRVPTWPELEHTEVPCTSDEVSSAWLNNELVRNAIHAQPENVVGAWELCSGNINYYHDAGSMIKYHRNLTLQGYRALIFRSMGYEVADEWRPWIFDGQVAGYTQGYDHNLTFLTIKGAGHTVPEYKPREALAFYSRWLNAVPI